MVQLTPGHWASIVSVVLDAIALLALSLTGEVPTALFGAVAGGIALAIVSRWVIPFRILVFLFILAFGAILALWLGLHRHPVVAVAHGIPVVHALLWFAPRIPLYRGWRIGLGFVELILSSGLTTEGYLPLSIMAYVILTSVALSCDFIEREAARAGLDLGSRRLAGSFVRRNLLGSLLILVLAGIIFPLLPRPKHLNPSLPTSVISYTESVNLGEWSRVRPQNGGEVQLRLYPPRDVDLTTEIYLGLLRGRVLDLFDGTNWYASSGSHLPMPQKAGLPSRKEIRVEVVREAIGAEALPVPYGTRSVYLMGADFLRLGAQKIQGEWSEPGSASRRTRYFMELLPNDLRYLKDVAEYDAPTEVHLKVPEVLSNDRIERLAKQIFGKAVSPADKLNRLRNYFRKEGFAPTGEAEVSDEAVDNQLRASKLHLIEKFLFVTKQGHCAWFSSAAALLLRLGGVPSRLVAGYRMSTSQAGGVLTIRSGDAHAWVEVFLPGQGWIPVDLTPRITVGGSWLDPLRSLGDALGAYWYRYVVVYGDDLTSKAGWWENLRRWWNQVRERKSIQNNGSDDPLSPLKFPLTWITLLFGGGGGVLWFWFQRNRGGARSRLLEGVPALQRARKKAAKLAGMRDLEWRDGGRAWVEAITQARGSMGGRIARSWCQVYEEARFGAAGVSSAQLERLSQLCGEILKIPSSQRSRHS